METNSMYSNSNRKPEIDIPTEFNHKPIDESINDSLDNLTYQRGGSNAKKNLN